MVTTNPSRFCRSSNLAFCTTQSQSMSAYARASHGKPSVTLLSRFASLSAVSRTSAGLRRAFAASERILDNPGPRAASSVFRFPRAFRRPARNGRGCRRGMKAGVLRKLAWIAAVAGREKQHKGARLQRLWNRFAGPLLGRDGFNDELPAILRIER